MTLAGAVVAVWGLGRWHVDVPAGVLVSRLGERGAMLAGTGGLAVVALGAGLRPSPIVFAVLMFVMGCGWSNWLLPGGASSWECGGSSAMWAPRADRCSQVC